MNPLKHKLANEWMRQDDASPEEALETWNTMEAEFKLNRAALQEPRTMAQEPRNMAHGGRIGLKPGGIVEPGVEYYGKFTEAEKRVNISAWEKETGKKFKDITSGGHKWSITHGKLPFSRVWERKEL